MYSDGRSQAVANRPEAAFKPFPLGQYAAPRHCDDNQRN